MWRVLRGAGPQELRVDTTLNCGQAFRWVATGENEWTGELAGMVVSLMQTPTEVHYCVRSDAARTTDADVEDVLRDYFQLDVNLTKLYADWSERDAVFKKRAQSFMGIRILRQPPVENMITFICSSCNNIPRITSMVHKLCKLYGKPAGSWAGREFYSFPPMESLCDPSVDAALREQGFGYRAKYIQQTAQRVVSELGVRHASVAEWLMSLRELPYEEVHAVLCSLPGIGAKVADCICLMSLDKRGAIPVDTHVWQIAVRDYAFTTENKSLTPRTYRAVGDLFRSIHGEYAGWAHSVLFTADLRQFEGRSEVKVERLSKAEAAAKSLKRELEPGEAKPKAASRKQPSKKVAIKEVAIKEEV